MTYHLGSVIISVWHKSVNSRDLCRCVFMLISDLFCCSVHCAFNLNKARSHLLGKLQKSHLLQFVEPIRGF